jgi:hypothetical protein
MPFPQKTYHGGSPRIFHPPDTMTRHDFLPSLNFTFIHLYN